MDITGIIILVVLLAAATFLVMSMLRRRPKQEPETSASNYAAGLNALLAGEKETALEKLKLAVKKDSQNIDAYLKIGDIFRELGKHERAISVHRYLMVRRGLTRRQYHDIMSSLARDYVAISDYEKAIGVVNKVLSAEKDVVWAHELKLELFEQMEDWEGAVSAYRELKRYDHELENGKLAHYKVQQGLRLSREHRNREAQNFFKEAIKIAPDNPPGYIHLADSYHAENKKSEALRVLKQFVERVPDESHLAFERIKRLLYEGGVYGEIENLYRHIIETQPNNLMAYLALAENYEKKGDYKRAIQTCEDVLDRDQSNKDAKRKLIRLHHKIDDDDRALQIALELIGE